MIYSFLNVDLQKIKSQNDSFYKEISKIKFEIIKSKIDSTTLISLNHSSKKMLTKLPYIGNKTAQKIIDYRKKHSFKKIEDFMKIKGIGKKRFIKIKKNLTL